MPLTVAARPKTWTVFVRSNTDSVGSNQHEILNRFKREARARNCSKYVTMKTNLQNQDAWDIAKTLFLFVQSEPRWRSQGESWKERKGEDKRIWQNTETLMENSKKFLCIQLVSKLLLALELLRNATSFAALQESSSTGELRLVLLCAVNTYYIRNYHAETARKCNIFP
jgi:hypothetical protein